MKLCIKGPFALTSYNSNKCDLVNIAPNHVGRNFLATKSDEKSVTNVTKVENERQKYAVIVD